MGVAEREHHLFAFHLRAVADADDVELALEAVGHAGHGIGHQASRQTVKLPELRILADSPRQQMPVAHLEADSGGMRLPQLALGTLYFDRLGEHLDGDAFRNRDWLLADT